MSLEFDPITGRLWVEEDGRTALDTSASMTNLIPSETITLTSYDITFPNLYYGTIFEQVRQGPDMFGSYTFGCSTWIGIVAQEWGPTAAGSYDYNISDVVLTTVPTGTDYLDCWVNLTRTVNPGNIFDLQLSSNFPQGQWVKLEGGSCLIEEFGGVSRLFEIRLSGTNVILRRYQSAAEGGNSSIPVLRSNPGATIGNETFFYPGTNAPVDGSKYALYGQKIQELGPDRNGPTHRPSGKEAGSSNNVPCSMSTSGISYASTWTGSIKITPGRIS